MTIRRTVRKQGLTYSAPRQSLCSSFSQSNAPKAPRYAQDAPPTVRQRTWGTGNRFSLRVRCRTDRADGVELHVSAVVPSRLEAVGKGRGSGVLRNGGQFHRAVRNERQHAHVCAQYLALRRVAGRAWQPPATAQVGSLAAGIGDQRCAGSGRPGHDRPCRVHGASAGRPDAEPQAVRQSLCAGRRGVAGLALEPWRTRPLDRDRRAILPRATCRCSSVMGKADATASLYIDRG